MVGQLGRLQHLPGDDAAGQRMAGADHRHHLHRGQRLHRDARVAEMLAGDDAQGVAAVQQGGDRAASGSTVTRGATDG